jgi:hypothetical protein
MLQLRKFGFGMSRYGMHHRKLFPSPSFLLSTAALCVAVGGAAYAAGQPASTGSTVHACVSKTTGVVRLVRRCTTRERAVTWNRTGPAGPSAAYDRTVYNPVDSAGIVSVSVRVPMGQFVVSGGCTATDTARVGAPLSFTYATASLTSTGHPSPPNPVGIPPEWDAAASVPSQGMVVGTGEGTAGAASLSDNGGFSLRNSGTITQRCQASQVSVIYVTAIKVSTLRGSVANQAK